MKYSVLMSVYAKESPKFLYESINSMLKQTVTPDEIIIVKDGILTDELENVLYKFENTHAIKTISIKENVGLGEALNIGMKHCRNEMIARMDSDDISRPDRCEKQLRMFAQDSSLAIVSSSVAEFDEDISSIKAIKSVPTSHRNILLYAKRRNPFNHPAVMYKKSAVQLAGGYKHFELFEDYYLWVRLIMNGNQCANIDEPILYMRANKGMYKRRGGVPYLKCIIRFKSRLRSMGFISNTDFFISVLAQGFVAVLPNTIRIMIYRKILRTKK